MKVLFAGPSLHRDLVFLRRHHGDVDWRGPARCGDIARAVRDGASAIGLVDGLFDQNAAPWHKEILFALSVGVAVAGGASMGALRAAECSAFGMVGIGAIYDHYAAGGITDDADVAQLHAPAELNYLPLSDPWVNVAPTFALMQQEGVLGEPAMRSLSATARGMHYSERTYQEIIRRADRLTAAEAETVSHWLADHAIDQKRIDAMAVLDWLHVQPAQRSELNASWHFQETTQWLALLGDLDDAAA